MTDTSRTAEQVLAAVLARTGPVTVYGAQVDAADPGDIVAVHEMFGPQAHRAPMTVCLRRQYSGDVFGPVGSVVDDEDQLTLTDTAGRHVVITRRSYPTVYQVVVDPAGVVLAPAHVDALRQFLTSDEELLSAEEHAEADDALLHELRASANRQIEHHLQETGRLRARADAAEQLLRRYTDEGVEAVEDPGSVLYAARELLGMDGRTGWAPGRATASETTA